MSQTAIPFLDLVTPHVELEAELTAVFQRALRSAAFIGGPAVEEFERAFATFCEAEHAIGVNSGTDALRFALIAAGIGLGDAVVTVPNTFIATAEAVSQSGARPLFVDVDRRAYTLDPRKLQELLENECVRDERTGRLVHRQSGLRVAGVIPVHLYGQMADMDPILDLARQHSLVVIEDACQAHGAQYYSPRTRRWHRAGSLGDAAAFSFYPGKNLGACGEGGAITTNDTGLASKCRMLRDHGQAKKYFHDMEGYNGRLDAIQAGLLSVKLRHLPEWTQQRRAAAERYDQLFAGASDVIAPFVPSYSRPVYHLYVIQVSDRNGLQEHLGKEGIGTGIHYPIPLHRQKAYGHMGYKAGDFPVTEAQAGQILSLPMYPQLQESQQRTVVSSILRFLAAKTAVATVG